MIKIKLVQDAKYCRGEKHLHTNTGDKTLYSLSEWFEALGVDFLGNNYEVVWAITNHDATELEDMCDWAFPEEIFSFSENKPVSAEIIF